MTPLGELLEWLVDLLVDAVDAGSYPAVFALMTLESALVPIPSEVVMPFAGLLVARGRMDFWASVASGVMGNLAGSLTAYWLGRSWGREAVLRLPWITEGHLNSAEEFFRRRGRSAVLVGRVTPAVRTFISLPAGMAGMDPAEFSVLTAVGSVPWNAALVWAGVVLEENWTVVREFLEPLALIAVLVAAILLWRWLSCRG